jgi:hypothetical protein
MKYFYTIILILLLYITIVSGQTSADVEFSIISHDNTGLRDTLFFGLDLTATDGLDIQLNEFDLPPPPPGNAFDVRFWLPPFSGALSSWRDYRAPGDPPAFPFNGNKQHVIKFQSTDYPFTFSWSLPPAIDPSSTIKDPFGGVIINASFSGTDSVIVNNAAITQLNISVNYSNILPVELFSFTAEISDYSVLLKWVTASELNNKGFYIERRQPESEWQSIGFVPGAGTSSETKFYTFQDARIIKNIYKYRLKQVDFDGTYSYSQEIIADLVPNKFVLNQNYPNPFNPSTTISFSLPEKAQVSLSVYNLIGEKVSVIANQVLEKGTYSFNWNASVFKSGVYFYELRADDVYLIKKMQLIK